MPSSNLCSGNVCVNCCRCSQCDRTVGTRHLNACACLPDALHWECRDCASKHVARILAPYANTTRHRRFLSDQLADPEFRDAYERANHKLQHNAES